MTERAVREGRSHRGYLGGLHRLVEHGERSAEAVEVELVPKPNAERSDGRGRIMQLCGWGAWW
jgi:hypothetical protein